MTGCCSVSNAISQELNLGNGKFYTIIPKGINEEHLYEFAIGGRIYPYKREEEELIKQVINHSGNIITSLHEYVTTSKSHSICLEDYSANPAGKHVIGSNRQFYLIGNRIFYLINDTYSFEEINTYFNWAGGFGFLCALLKIPYGLSSLSLEPQSPD